MRTQLPRALSRGRRRGVRASCPSREGGREGAGTLGVPGERLVKGKGGRGGGAAEGHSPGRRVPAAPSWKGAGRAGRGATRRKGDAS